jgi:hypothetical protein
VRAAVSCCHCEPDLCRVQAGSAPLAQTAD